MPSALAPRDDLAFRLQRELRLDTGKRVAGRPTPEQAVAAATARFLEHQRVDMQLLAADLGVGRATLYRWFGDREQLLGRVLWGLSAQTLAWLAAESPGAGAERVVATAAAFMRVTSGYPPLRHFLCTEPGVALRALLDPGSPLVLELTRWTAQQLRAEGIGAGEPSAEELAVVLVSVTSTFCWVSIVAGAEPDLDAATLAVRVLLRAPLAQQA
jgi:AcrR family transcriptional regulator